MAGYQPRGQEDAEHCVARNFEMNVFEHFRQLPTDLSLTTTMDVMTIYIPLKAMLTYWQQKVDDIHDNQNHIADVRPAVGICDVHQKDSNYMMGEHLRIVFTSLLQIDGQELLQAEGKLDKVVPFELPSDLARRPGRPQLFEVEPIRRVHEKILRMRSEHWSERMFGRGKHTMPMVNDKE